MPLPPYYLEVALTCRMVCVIVMMMYRGGILKVLFESFPKGLRGSPYVFIIISKVTALEPVYSPTFVDHWVYVLGGDQKVSDGAVTFEVVLNTIPPTDLFNAFAKTLDIWYYYMTLCFDFIGNGMGASGTLAVSPIIDLPGRPVKSSPHLIQSPSGVLQWVSAFLI